MKLGKLLATVATFAHIYLYNLDPSLQRSFPPTESDAFHKLLFRFQLEQEAL